jgi:outer membrane receptor protein involved in Fe transport
MTGDPHLKQVVARTFELGARGKAIFGVNWQAAAYNSRAHDDILFVGARSAGKGYFKNFGMTQKRGIDLALNKKFDNLALAGNYSYLESTFESDDSFVSNWNDTSGTAVGADANSQSRMIDVKKGNEIPGAPNNILKLFANYDFNEKLRFSANTRSVGSIWVRGAENNQGTGSKLPGYTLMNIAATYEWASGFTFFGKVNNLFDKEYYTGGQMGSNVFDANGVRIRPGSTTTGDTTCGAGFDCRRNQSNPIMEAFAAPGAPISGWIGIRYEFGGAKKAESSDRD